MSILPHRSWTVSVEAVWPQPPQSRARPSSLTAQQAAISSSTTRKPWAVLLPTPPLWIRPATSSSWWATTRTSSSSSGKARNFSLHVSYYATIHEDPFKGFMVRRQRSFKLEIPLQTVAVLCLPWYNKGFKGNVSYTRVEISYTKKEFHGLFSVQGSKCRLAAYM